MRYVVTGSAGFIGSHVCQTLLAAGHAVDGVDVFTDYYDPALKRANNARLLRYPGFSHFELDLATHDRRDIEDLCGAADAVIHLAAQPGVRLSWTEGFQVYVACNMTASQRVLEAARHTGLSRLVLASSSSVYGNAPAYPTSEDSPTRPFSPYGVTKLAMEHLALAYADNWGLPAVMLRYFTVYGPGQRPDMALHRFIAAAGAGEPVTVYGDGEQIRDFTYVSDVVAATLAAADADLAGATILNVAGGSSSTVNGVLQLVSESVGRQVGIRHVAEQPGDVRVTGGVIDRARRLLDWEPEVPLDEGIKRQVEYQIGAAGADSS